MQPPDFRSCNSFDSLREAMQNTEQTKGMSVYEHGVDVNKHLKDLCEILNGCSYDTSYWKIPVCLINNSKQILSNLHNPEVVSQYAIWHDCGKPFVKTIDVDGKVHFPNHAEISKKLYYRLTGDGSISDLIGWDMIIHSGSSEEISHLLKTEWCKKDAYTLLLAALAELHSNANMFGGQDTISFKTKYTKIERRAKQICKLLEEKT
jgi:hypothetical protein